MAFKPTTAKLTRIVRDRNGQPTEIQVFVTIDWEAVANDMAKKAWANKSKVAREIGGGVEVEVRPLKG
jgi:hypothetical protein